MISPVHFFSMCSKRIAVDMFYVCPACPESQVTVVAVWANFHLLIPMGIEVANIDRHLLDHLASRHPTAHL